MFWPGSCVVTKVVRLFYSGQNVLFQHQQQRIQFLFRGIPAQGDAEGAVNNFRSEAHGFENMAAVALGAGAARADTNTGILQNVDGVLGGHPGNGEGENVGRFMGTVDGDALQPGKLLHQAADQRLFPLGILPEGGGHGGAGSGEAEDGGRPFRTAAQAAFLTAA